MKKKITIEVSPKDHAAFVKKLRKHGKTIQGTLSAFVKGYRG